MELRIKRPPSGVYRRYSARCRPSFSKTIISFPNASQTLSVTESTPIQETVGFSSGTFPVCVSRLISRRAARAAGGEVNAGSEKTQEAEAAGADFGEGGSG